VKNRGNSCNGHSSLSQHLVSLNHKADLWSPFWLHSFVQQSKTKGPTTLPTQLRTAYNSTRSTHFTKLPSKGSKTLQHVDIPLLTPSTMHVIMYNLLVNLHFSSWQKKCDALAGKMISNSSHTKSSFYTVFTLLQLKEEFMLISCICVRSSCITLFQVWRTNDSKNKNPASETSVWFVHTTLKVGKTILFICDYGTFMIYDSMS